MDNEEVVRSWQKAILAKCVEKLGRKLTEKEERLIISRGGFMALEFIEDKVDFSSSAELEVYLNQE